MKTSQGISPISALQIGETESTLNNQVNTYQVLREGSREKCRKPQAKNLDLSSGRHTGASEHLDSYLIKDLSMSHKISG